MVIGLRFHYFPSIAGESNGGQGILNIFLKRCTHEDTDLRDRVVNFDETDTMTIISYNRKL